MKKIVVVGCEKSKRGSFDKKDVCLYCEKTFINTSFMRHLDALHNEEEEVKILNSMKKGSSEKRRYSQLLRNRGNFHHNVQVLQKGGELIIAQRPRMTVDVTNILKAFVMCSHCLGFYNRREIWRHMCPAGRTKPRRKVELSDSTMPNEVADFFLRLKADETGKIARQDRLLWKLISSQVLAKGLENYRTISEKVRVLCSFLKRVRDKI